MIQIYKNWLWIGLIILGAYLYVTNANKFNETYIGGLNEPSFKITILKLDPGSIDYGSQEFFSKSETLNAIAINENKLVGFFIFILSLLMLIIENNINMEALKVQWKKKKRN